MAEVFHYHHQDEAGWFLRRLRDNNIWYEDSARLENLFNADRISACDEAIFLKDEDGEVLALAIIAKSPPSVWSYYTIPQYRGNGRGYRLLVRCLERILEGICDPDLKVEIEPINGVSKKHVDRLPAHLRERLKVVRR